MATLEELVVQLVAETSGLRSELDKATKSTSASMDKMEKAVKDFTENSSKSLSVWETALATASGFIGSQAVIGAYNKLAEAAKFVSDQLLEGGKRAIEEEKSFIKLANSIALTGQYTREAMTDLVNFSEEMEVQTGIGAELVASNLAVLSSLTKLDSEGLKKAQTSAIDLSAALGIDLNAATLLVAKGIAGNTGVFTRYGFTVQQGTTATENLANITKALASIQGSAAGQMKTFDGALKSLNSSYENLIEAYANVIVKNEAYVAAILALANALRTTTADITDQDQALKVLAGQTLVAFIDTVAVTITALDTLGRGISLPFVYVSQAIQTAIQTLKSFADLITLDFSSAIDGMVNRVKGIGQAFEDTFRGNTTLGSLATTLMEVGNAAEKGLEQVKQGASATVEPTVKARDAVEQLTAAETKRLEQLKEFSTALAEQGAALDAQYNYELESLTQHLENKLITEQDYLDLRNEMLVSQQETEIAQLEESRAAQQLTDQQYLDAKTALERKQSLESQKASADRLKFEEKTNKQRLADMQSTLGYIATLQNSSSKTLGAIGKAAAIAQATIDGYAAVQKALASAPPPVNFALAAAVGIATASNIAKINGVALNSGGRIRGGGADRDSVPAMLTTGESVVDRTDTQRLSRFLDSVDEGNAGVGRTVVEITINENLMDLIETRIVERQRIGTSLLQGT